MTKINASAVVYGDGGERLTVDITTGKQDIFSVEFSQVADSYRLALTKLDPETKSNEQVASFRQSISLMGY